MSRAENGQLRMQLQLLLEEKNKLAQGLKHNATLTFITKSELEARAQELEAQNTVLAERLRRAKTAGTIADGEEAEDLRNKIAILERNKEEVMVKLKKKLQDVLLVLYEQSMKVKGMETSQIDPVELQEMRKEVQVLLNEKAAFTNKHGEQKVALQNAQMWFAQNEQIRLQIANRTKLLAQANQRIADTRTDLEKFDREKAFASDECSRLAGVLAEHERQMVIEKDSERNSVLWIQQNELLHNQIYRIERENRMIAARCKDWEEGNTDCKAEKAEMLVQLEENKKRKSMLEESAAHVHKQTKELTDSIPVIEGEIGNFIASKSGLQMQVRQLKRKGEAAALRADKIRLKMLDAEQEKNALILKNEELVANLKKVEEWDLQNDKLRWTMQELLDVNNQRVERMDRYVETSELMNAIYRCFECHAYLNADDEECGLCRHPAEDRLEGTPSDSDAEEEKGRKSEYGNIRHNVVLLEKKKPEYEQLKAFGDRLSKGGASVEDVMARTKMAAEQQVDRNEADMDLDMVEAEDDEDTEEIKFVRDEDLSSGKYAQIRCATLEKLVERLTYEKFPDMEYNQAFMLTYRSFSTPLEVLELAIQRYCVTPPSGLDPEGLKDFKAKKQIPIRLRVFNVLKGWINDYFYDFESDDQLVATVLDFVDHTMPATGMARPAQALKKTLTRKLQEAQERVLSEAQANKPVPEKQRIKSFDRVDTKALARTITVQEQAIYTKIAPQECFRLAWSKKNREKEAPNILKLVRRFNDMSTWVQYEILSGADMGQHRGRAAQMKKFIKLASDLAELNNFNGCMAVIAGLEASSIYRLKSAWQRLDSKAMEKFTELKDMMSANNNYKRLRKKLHMADPPCIPYLGMYLTDLTFIEDGNSDVLEGLINYVKRRYYANVIREIQQYQQVKYKQEVDSPCAHFLLQQWEMARKALPDENTSYEMSLQMEPRGTN